MLRITSIPTVRGICAMFFPHHLFLLLRLSRSLQLGVPHWNAPAIAVKMRERSNRTNYEASIAVPLERIRRECTSRKKLKNSEKNLCFLSRQVPPILVRRPIAGLMRTSCSSVHTAGRENEERKHMQVSICPDEPLSQSFPCTFASTGRYLLTAVKQKDHTDFVFIPRSFFFLFVPLASSRVRKNTKHNFQFGSCSQQSSFAPHYLLVCLRFWMQEERSCRRKTLRLAKLSHFFH